MKFKTKIKKRLKELRKGFSEFFTGEPDEPTEEEHKSEQRRQKMKEALLKLLDIEEDLK